MLKVGERIKNVNPDRKKRSSDGKLGFVTKIVGSTVHVRYDDGTEGKTANPSRYYKKVDGVQDFLKALKEFIEEYQDDCGEDED